jgi:serine/threonine protein kinase/tetratricopeptide (TPR) repeat protein
VDNNLQTTGSVEDNPTRTRTIVQISSQTSESGRHLGLDRRSSHRPRPVRRVAYESIDRFAILDLIGRGGMGELYLGWDDRLDRKVAIKLVDSRRQIAHAEQLLLREAKLLGQLSHPNVVSVFEVGVFEERVFVAMEFVEGVTLRQWLADLELGGAARTRAILACFAAAGRGLAAVHAAGLAHHDFKPENVLVGTDGRVRIVDFGLARSLDELGDEFGRTKTDGTPVAFDHVSPTFDTEPLETPLLGTPRYMAPEQWAGLRGDARSDQFSFCVALYEALFGHGPFEARGIEQLADAAMGGRIRPMPRNADVPQHVREALLRGLSTTPEHRFPGIGPLLEALQPTAPSRRPRAFAAITLVLMAALASASIVWSQARAGPIPAGESSFAKVQRELHAADRLARAESQIEALSEAGSFAQADEVFRGFAELPDHANTLALTRGWLGQAQRLERRGELEAELDAYATAYVSNSPDHRQRALFGLARAFMRTRQWQRLGATLDAIEAGAAGAATQRSGRKSAREHASAGSPGLDPQQLAELRAMRVAVLASCRDLVGAARAVEPVGGARDPNDGPAGEADEILREAMLELGRTRVTKHELDGSGLVLAELANLDLDGDEVGELVIAGADGSSLTILGTGSPELPEIGRLELDSGRGPALPIADLHTLEHEGQALVAVRRGTTHSLYRIIRARDRASETQLRAKLLGEHAQDGQHAASWALADLDHDEALELYLGLQAPRQLLGLELGPRSRPGQGRWRDPHPGTTAASSVIYGLEAADLDGDGDDELAMLAGEWSAYDLRILAPARVKADREAGAPKLRLLGRRKLGAVHSLALLPAASGRGQWIAVGVADSYPSRRVFPAGAPGGAPGLHLLAWDGTSVRLLESFDLPWPTRIFTGDFDGNGLHDLALAGSRDGQDECTLVFQIRVGEFRSLPLRELRPVGVIDVDDDGDDELLAVTTDEAGNDGSRRGALYVLGTGEQRLPTLTREPTPSKDSDAARVARASGRDPALRGAIARAEDLAAIGLPLRATNSLRALARVADERLAALLRVRAAELLDSRGHRLEAADLYARALVEPGALGTLRHQALDRAIELYTQIHRFDQAAKLIATALREGDDHRELASELHHLQALSQDTPQLVFDFESPLDEHWSINPLAVRRQHGRLELTLGGAEQGVIARRELDWNGGRLALEVELDIEELEWGGGINVELRPVDGPARAPFDVGVSSWGGGGIYRMELRCTNRGQHEPGSRGWPVPLPRAELPPERHHLELSAEYVPGSGLWCVAEGEGLHVESPVDAVLAPGRYELLIHGSSYAWPRARASIERITIIGASEVDTPRVAVDLRSRLGRELAEGRVESVLAQLDAPNAQRLAPRERALLRFWALDDLGRWEQAKLALVEALGLSRVGIAGDCRRDPATAMLVGQLLRHRPDRFGPPLRELCRPDDYFPLLFQAWATAIYQHPDGDAVERMLITQTTGLECWEPSNPEDQLAVLILLRARARAWSAQGAHGAARSELERAVELASRWLDGSPELDEGRRVTLAVELALSRTDLAAELFDRGKEQRAIEALRLALSSSPTPEILADMLVIDPRFFALRERPLWRELVEPARAGGRL